jgi:catechol 2,3-dioxygenase-like lactoylglutathione lyase family enzyme
MFLHGGLVKLAFRTPIAKAKLAQLADLGIHTTNRLIYRGYVSIQDPDGIVLSFVGSHTADLEPGATDPRRYERLVHTNPSVSDLNRALEFYGNVIGLDVVGEYLPGEPMDVSQGPGTDRAQWAGYSHAARGGGFFLEVNHFAHPPRSGADLVPYAEPTHVGVARVGLEVDDIDQSYATLLRASDAGLCAPPLSPPEEWDYGPELGIRRVVAFHDPDGIRLELTERRAFVSTGVPVRPDNPPPLPGV